MSVQSIDNQIISAENFQADIDETVRNLETHNFVERFWNKDASLWGGGPEREAAVSSMLGWVDIVEKMEARLPELDAFIADIKAGGFERVILAGMGGSSLAPLVFSLCCPKGEGGLPLDVLDSTDPATVLRIERAGDLSKTLVVVSSKSGSTAEPTAFDHYLLGKIQNPKNMVAITDPGSPFAKSAEDRGFRKIFLNYADIGGRFSALSFFGLVPAALMGLDVREMLHQAKVTAEANAKGKHFSDAPAFLLGAAIGTLATQKRNKLTFITPESLSSLGLWMEQLVAESTGKLGTGVLPVAGEPVGPPSVYGRDRIFVAFRPAAQDCTALDVSIAPLRDAGHPVVMVDLASPYSIAQEMFRFEIATAVVGAILDINPFDQPNVQESKDITKKLLSTVEKDGHLAPQPVSLTEGPLQLLGENCAESIAEALRTFLFEKVPGDYVAIMAYLPEKESLTSELHRFQREVRDRTGLATTVGYGPRFLHSTGQFHKGGPAVGFYIQLTGDHAEDAPIPGQRATWAQFIDAQAEGDLEALRTKGRRTLRVHLVGDKTVAVSALVKAFDASQLSDSQSS